MQGLIDVHINSGIAGLTKKELTRHAQLSPLHAKLTSMSIDHYDSAAAIRRARSHTASQACSSFPSTAAM